MEWVYQSELARRAGVSRSTVVRLIHRGLLPVDGTGRVPAAAADLLRRRWAVVLVDTRTTKVVFDVSAHASHKEAMAAARAYRPDPGFAAAVAELTMVAS